MLDNGDGYFRNFLSNDLDLRFINKYTLNY